MRITLPLVVYNVRHVVMNETIQIGAHPGTQPEPAILKDAVAYPAFINSHDHLIGNWFPRAGRAEKYINSHIWVEDMKQTQSYRERNKVWLNDGSFDLMKGNARLLTMLGAYKNLFSGCTVVQDHAPNQKPEYYDQFPIQVLRDYRQFHSITLGNWWGGEDAGEEMKATGGKMPFILHLGEGMDPETSQEFSIMEEQGLLRKNTLIIHGISLTIAEIQRAGAAHASVCWCPGSNYYLIGRAVDVDACLRYGVNVVLGTDSTMSGNINLFAEIRDGFAHKPHLPYTFFFEAITSNAARALMLPEPSGRLTQPAMDIIILKRKREDPFQNLLQVDMEDIILLCHQGRPLYGYAELLCEFDVSEKDYTFFHPGDHERFVIGDPIALNRQVDDILGYHKDFPYLPF